MTCREFIDFLDDYLAGAQPDELRREFERHLQLCASCRDYLRTYRDTVALARAACSDPDAPPDAPKELVNAILAAIRK